MLKGGSASHRRRNVRRAPKPLQRPAVLAAVRLSPPAPVTGAVGGYPRRNGMTPFAATPLARETKQRMRSTAACMAPAVLLWGGELKVKKSVCASERALEGMF